MARVTVEDCVTKIPNRFDLVILSAQRARNLSAGASLQVERDNDKNAVVALREIAEEKVELEALRETLVQGHQKFVAIEGPDEEIIELMSGEAGWDDSDAPGDTFGMPHEGRQMPAVSEDDEEIDEQVVDAMEAEAHAADTDLSIEGEEEE